MVQALLSIAPQKWGAEKVNMKFRAVTNKGEGKIWILT
jgi:hypothetical protein